MHLYTYTIVKDNGHGLLLPVGDSFTSENTSAYIGSYPGMVQKAVDRKVITESGEYRVVCARGSSVVEVSSTLTVTAISKLTVEPS